MAEPVIISLEAGGIAEVKRAFKDVADVLAKLDKVSNASSQRSAKERVSIARTEATAVVKAEKEKSKATEQEAKVRQKQATSVLKEVQKSAQAEAKAVEKAERDKTKAVEQWSKQRERIATNSALMAGRIAAREVQEENRARSRFARSVGGGAGRGVSRLASGAASLVGGALALGGGFGIADAISKETRASGMAADIANSGYIPGDPLNNRLRSSKEIMSSARGVGVQYGMNSEEVLGGLQAFTGKTGRLDMGLSTMKPLAELARATGSSFTDLADAMGDAFNADTAQSAEDVLGIMKHIAGQGKLGAVEIRDLATQMAKVSASAGMFGGNRQSNVVDLGVLAQMARAKGGASSADEAATSVQRFASDVSKKAFVFKKLGIDVKDGKVLRSPESIIQSTLTKTGGDNTILSHLFGERSVRSVLGFADVYRTAGGGKKGNDAVHAEFERLRGATLTDAQTKEAAGARMQENDAKIEQAMAQFQQVIGEKLVPELTKLIPHLTELVPQFAKLLDNIIRFADWLSDNPIKGIGAVITAAIIKEIAAAGLGMAIKNVLTSAVASLSGGGGASGLAGNLGAAGAIGAAATGLTMLGMAGIDQSFGNENAKQSSNIGTSLSAIGLAGRGGNMSPEELAKAKANADSLRSQIAEMKSGSEGVASAIFRPFAQTFNGDAQRTKDKAQADTIKRSTEALEKLTIAIQKSERALGGMASNTNPNTPGRNGPMSVPARGGAP